MNYTMMPTEENKSQPLGNYLFEPLINELKEITHYNPVYWRSNTHSKKAVFMDTCAMIDSLYRLTNPDIDSVAYISILDEILPIYNGIGNIENYTGLAITKTYSDDINESNFKKYFDKAIRLNLAEEAFKKDSEHELFIFIKPREDVPTPLNGILYVVTNKALDWETLCRLEALKYSETAKLYGENYYIKEIYNAFLEQSVEKLNSILNELHNSDIVAEAKYKEFEKKFNENTANQIAQYKTDLDHYRGCIMTYENKLASIGRTIRITNENLERLQSKDNSEEIRILYKFLKKNPYISRFDIYGSILYLHYEAPLIYYTDLPIEKMMNNFEEFEFRYKVLKLFLDRKFELWTECEIKFNIDTFETEIVGLSQYEYGLFLHPHINEYYCFGNHREQIEAASETNNYIGAIEQISQAVLNMNFYDSCVANYLLNAMADEEMNLYTWKDTTTGEMLKVTEAIERNESYDKTEINK